MDTQNPTDGRQYNRRTSAMFWIIFLVILVAIVLVEGKFFSPKNSPSAPTSQTAQQSSQNNQASAPTPASQNGNVMKQSAAPFNSSAPQVDLPQSYTNTTMNYTIKYTADWVYTLQSDGTMTFSGPDGSPAYNSTVTIAPETGGTTMDTVVASNKSDYTSDATSKAQVTNDQNINFNLSDGSSVSGKSFQVDYVDSTNNNTSYRDLVVVIPRGSQFMSFTYSSPTSQYDTYSGTAQAMFNDWSVNK